VDWFSHPPPKASAVPRDTPVPLPLLAKNRGLHACRKDTVIVEVGSWRAEIDVTLAPLIREIWIAGIETMMSCQETQPETAWVEFVSVEETLRFLNLVTHFESGVDTLYNRIFHRRSGPMAAPVWEYQLNLLDIFEEQEEQIIDGIACFEATAGVDFPRSDISVLLERLRAVNSTS
jgi:hypothetical protein